MKKNKNIEPQAQEAEQPQQEAFVDVQSAGDAPKPSGKKFTLKLDENGNILWDQVSESHKERFASAVANDPTALEMIGLAAGGATPDGGFAIPEFTEENIKAALEFLAKANAFSLKFAIGKFAKLPIDNDITFSSFSFSEEQMAELVPRGTRLANKYTPEFLRKYQDEIMFAGMFIYYTTQQAQEAIKQQLLRNMAEKMKQARPVNGKEQPIGAAA